MSYSGGGSCGSPASSASNRTPRGSSHSGGSAIPQPSASPEPNRGGRSLCRLADPVMSLIELEEMLEEMDVVPHLVSRQDVFEAFKVALQVSCYSNGLGSSSRRLMGLSGK